MLDAPIITTDALNAEPHTLPTVPATVVSDPIALILHLQGLLTQTYPFVPTGEINLRAQIQAVLRIRPNG